MKILNFTIRKYFYKIICMILTIVMLVFQFLNDAILIKESGDLLPYYSPLLLEKTPMYLIFFILTWILFVLISISMIQFKRSNLTYSVHYATLFCALAMLIIYIVTSFTLTDTFSSRRGYIIFYMNIFIFALYLANLIFTYKKIQRVKEKNAENKIDNEKVYFDDDTYTSKKEYNEKNIRK